MPDLSSFSKPLPAGRAHRLTAQTSASLSRLALTRHPAFAWKLRQEGYRDFVFGAKSGPVANLDAVVHDMGHAVEFGPAEFETRCGDAGHFIFNHRQIEVLGNLYDDPLTSEATQRECRVFGIQYRLQGLMGRKQSLVAFCEDNVKSLDFMADYFTTTYAQRTDLVVEAVDRYRTPEILDRLEGWLDCTRSELERIEPEALAA